MTGGPGWWIVPLAVLGGAIRVGTPFLFVTVLAFKPYRAARARVLSFDAWSSARTRGVVREAP